MWVSLDNDVLSFITKSSQNIEEFCESVRNTEFKFCVTAEALNDAFAGDIEEFVVRRIRGLVQIRESLGNGRMQFLVQLKELLAFEYRRNGILTGPIFLSAQQHESLKSWAISNSGLWESRKESEPEIEKQRVRKREFLEMDRWSRDQFRGGKVNRNDIEDRLRQFPGVGPEKSQIDMFLPIFRGIGKNLSRTKLKRIVCSKDKFLAIRTLANLIYYRHLANALYDAPQDLAPMARIKSGNWWDINILAASVNCNLFVSNDGDLREFSEFLRNRGLVEFRAVSYEDFSSQCRVSKGKS